jgi:hypothetical protein
MMKDRKDEFSEILSLWKGQEEKYLNFSDIVAKMDKRNVPMKPKKWYVKKVNRRLDEMVHQHILEKKKNGTRGAEALYKPTFEAQEFDANHFFEGIRESSKQKGLINKENESLLLYGIPKKETLTPIEREILEHIIELIENSFENLFLLKKSITGREQIGAPLDSELIFNYVREATAKIFGNMITTEAELKATKEASKSRFHGACEMIIEVAKKSNIHLDSAEEIISQEQKLMDYDTPHLESPIYVPKGSDADLAILKTLASYRLAEYELNPFSQLAKLIDGWEPSDFDENIVWRDPFSGETVKGRRVARNPRYFDDADIFYLAQAFVRHMSPTIRSESSLTFEQMERLAEWGKLPLKLGGAKNHEKLIRCIYHFWKEQQDRVKADKEAEEAWLKLSPEEKQKLMEPRKLTFKIETVDLKKEGRISPEILAAIRTKMPAEIERKFTKK